MSIRKHAGATIITAALMLGLAGCAPATTPTRSAGPQSRDAAGQVSGTITVFAAASLKATFTQLASDFEAKNPGTKIVLSFAGSSDLVTQITQGAPADVFASADTKNMTKLAEAKLLDGTAKNFATNVLEIAVPPSNPASIASFADLAKPGVKVVVCASQVPCGPPRTPWKRPRE
ncbi:molybdate-binding protein [Arthrobacter sp. Hiyo4]|nr:molybdate-binding protein [Arthrobacter sp. Hiyo4]